MVWQLTIMLLNLHGVQLCYLTYMEGEDKKNNVQLSELVIFFFNPYDLRT